MIRKICLLTCHNHYESKQYFTLKLAEALKRRGIQAQIFTWPHGPLPDEIVEQINKLNPDLTCSFHPLPPQSNGHYFWDTLKRPHWNILIDPVFYDLEVMQSPYSIISCVDRNDCGFLGSFHFENVFFFPHAVERELIKTLGKDEARDLDVVLLGSCYDPDNLRAHWRKIYPKKVNEAIDNAIEIFLSDNHTTFFRAVLQALALHGIDSHEVEFDQIVYYVDNYARGIDRLQVVRSIRGAPVHVFGDKCWREEKPIADWSHYLSKQKNVTVHKGVNFAEALEIMKRSKICLNSVPSFKNGTHERIFSALACGSLPLTTDNVFMRENFEDGKDILLYQFTALDKVNDRLMGYLNDESKRRKLVVGGQSKVREHHTWDSRVDAMLHDMTPILNRLQTQV